MWEWLRVFDEFERKPKILILENVMGLLSSQKGAHYKLLHMALVERGFLCGAIVLNATSFVPQSRPRVFVLAVSKDLKIPNNLISNEPCWLHDKTTIALGKILVHGKILWDVVKHKPYSLLLFPLV